MPRKAASQPLTAMQKAARSTSTLSHFLDEVIFSDPPFPPRMEAKLKELAAPHAPANNASTSSEPNAIPAPKAHPHKEAPSAKEERKSKAARARHDHRRARTKFQAKPGSRRAGRSLCRR